MIERSCLGLGSFSCCADVFRLIEKSEAATLIVTSCNLETRGPTTHHIGAQHTRSGTWSS